MFIPPNVSGPTPRELEQQRLADPNQRRQDLVPYIVDCLNHGSPPAEIRSSLVAKGLTSEEAKALVQSVLQAHAGGRSPEVSVAPGTLDDDEEIALLAAVGRRNMAIGAIVFVIGAIITLVSLGSIQAGRGGVVAWGAIVFGGIQFFRGVNQVGSARG